MTRHRSGLTSRQRAVVRLLVDGLTCREIGVKLSISERTVRRHVEDIAEKCNGQGKPIRRILAAAKQLLEAA